MCNADLSPDVWHHDGPGGVGKVHFDTMVIYRASHLNYPHEHTFLTFRSSISTHVSIGAVFKTGRDVPDRLYGNSATSI